MFNINYNNLNEVLNYAKTLGKNNVVFKLKSRENYNITKTDRFNKIYLNNSEVEFAQHF